MKYYIIEKMRSEQWSLEQIEGHAEKNGIPMVSHESIYKIATLTIVGRKSGFLLRKLEQEKNADGLYKVMIDALSPYKTDVQTITSDNGAEFARHKEILKKPGADFYFAPPYSSWERGFNENTNGLIRQYIPKKQTFDNITELEINEIQIKINRRPRKKLGYSTPVQIFYRTLPKDVALAS